MPALRVGEREFEVEPLLDDAELDSRSSTGTIYWEGPVRLRAPRGEPKQIRRDSTVFADKSSVGLVYDLGRLDALLGDRASALRPWNTSDTV